MIKLYKPSSLYVLLATTFLVTLTSESKGAAPLDMPQGDHCAEHGLAEARRQVSEPIYILAIDGGGLRGLIPATLLLEFDRALFAHIKNAYPECPFSAEFYFSWLFRWMAGTSTGGLITLGLSCPKGNEVGDVESRPLSQFRKPAHTLDKVVSLYKDRARNIFPLGYKNFWNGLFSASYDPAPLEQYLEEYFGTWTLDDALHSLVIPTCSLTQQQTILLGAPSQHLPELMRSAARYTAAAPTYLEAAQGASLKNQREVYADGGVAANDPSLDAYLEVRKRYPTNPIVLLSLGTGEPAATSLADLSAAGKAGWAKHIAPFMMRMNSLLTNERLLKLKDIDPRLTYLRVQPELDRSVMEMDDARDSTLLSYETLGRNTMQTSEMRKAQDIFTTYMRQQNFYGYFPVIQELRNQIERINAKAQDFIDLSRRDLSLRGLWEVCHFLSTNEEARSALINTKRLDLSRNGLILTDPRLPELLEKLLAPLEKGIEFVNFSWNHFDRQETITHLLRSMGLSGSRYLAYRRYAQLPSLQWADFQKMSEVIIPESWNYHILFELGAQLFGVNDQEKAYLESLLVKSIACQSGFKDYIEYLFNPSRFRTLPTQSTVTSSLRYKRLMDVCKDEAESKEPKVDAAKTLAQIYGAFYLQRSLGGISGDICTHALDWNSSVIELRSQALERAKTYGALWERLSVYSTHPKEEREEAKRFLEALRSQEIDDVKKVAKR